MEMVKPLKQFGVDDVLLIIPKSGAFERANPEILKGIGQSQVWFSHVLTRVVTFFLGGGRGNGWRDGPRWLEDSDALICYTYLKYIERAEEVRV